MQCWPVPAAWSRSRVPGVQAIPTRHSCVHCPCTGSHLHRHPAQRLRRSIEPSRRLAGHRSTADWTALTRLAEGGKAAVSQRQELAGPGHTRTAAARRAATNGRFQASGSKAARPAVDPSATSAARISSPQSRRRVRGVPRVRQHPGPRLPEAALWRRRHDGLLANTRSAEGSARRAARVVALAMLGVGGEILIRERRPARRFSAR